MSNGGARRARASAAAMACVLAWGAVDGTARAQEADSAGDGAATPLQQIDVIGQLLRGWGGASDAVYETPGGVAEIGREAIDARGGARNAGEIFRGVAGVDAIINRQSPGVNVNIRGLQDQGRVAMTIDGARQNFQQTGHGSPNRVFIDPEFIRAVEIDKGPTSTAGGAGVIGGVVNFRTINFDDVALPGNDYGVKATATTGSNAYDFNGSLAAAAKVSEAFEIVGGLSHKKLGEYEAGKRGDEKLAKQSLPIAAYTSQDTWSWLLKARARPTDDHEITVTYNGLASDFGTGSYDKIDRDKVKAHTVVADWRWRPGNGWADLAVKGYYTRTSNDQFRPARFGGDPPDTTVKYAIDTFGGSIANTSRFSIPAFDVALTYGGEFFRDKTDTATVSIDPAANLEFTGANPLGERTVGGGFARAEFKHGEWLQILTGARYDAFKMTGSGVVFDTVGCDRRCSTPFDVDRSGGHLSPTATVGVTPVKGVQLYGSYEQGWRPPNIAESILGAQHVAGLPIYFAPNPNLKPETSRTVEAGVNLKQDGVFRDTDAFRAKVSVYRTAVDNFITQAGFTDPTGGLPFIKNVNLEKKTILKGFELEANYDAGFAFIGGSASFIRATYRPEYDDGSSNLPRGLAGIALAPKMKLTLDGGVRVWDEKITLGARMTHVTPDDETTVEESKPGDPPPTRFFDYWRYTVVDLYANAKINENFTIRASLENIRNVAYIDALGNPLTAAPGRTFTIGATARF